MENRLYLHPEATACGDIRLDSTPAKKLWSSFFLGDGALTLQAGTPLTFRLGSTPLPVLPEGNEYAIRIDSRGVAIIGRDLGGLTRGYMVFLMQLQYDGQQFWADYGCHESNYRIKNRMLHLCVFHEDSLDFLKKVVRYAALCQYTHVVLEFWGALQFDCLKELSWPQAFTKAQAKELIDECRALGVEPIPMFNHLGHASGSRWCYGKHVVLDQNPRLLHLFTPDGWVWNYLSEDVLSLLRKVRGELYDLFGDTTYFHLGCDEAGFVTNHAQYSQALPAYLKQLTDEVVAEGRRPMVWMDMLLEKGKYNEPGKKYNGSCPPEQVASLRDSLNLHTVMIDWQYGIKEAPVKSLADLKDDPRDAMGAPWYNADNIKAMADTVQQNDLAGVMMTTWNELHRRMPSLLGCAKQCGAQFYPWGADALTLFRRSNFEGNRYEDYGWSPIQLPIL